MRSRHFMGAAAALALGLFLLWGTLSGDDFVRGIYGGATPGAWDSLALLHPNRVWNYDDYGHATAQSYIDSAYAHGMKPFLRLPPDWTCPNPFWLEKYSCGLYQRYEAEQKYQDVSGDPTVDGFYFFWHGDNSSTVRGIADLSYPGGGEASWKCAQSTHTAGVMLMGPGETAQGIQHLHNTEEQSNWPDSAHVNRDYKAVLKVSAAAAGLGATDPVFNLQVWFDPCSSDGNLAACSLMVDTTFDKTAFQSVYYPTWKTFEVNYTVPGVFHADTLDGWVNIIYRLEWFDRCDFWVDCVEFMDMERAYYVHYRDASEQFVFRDSVMNQVVIPQIQTLAANNMTKLAGWKQSDEPLRASFQSHGVVNDSVRAHVAVPTTITPVVQGNTAWWRLRPERFVSKARPELYETDLYPFNTGSAVGQQSNLDSLSTWLERAYQACGDTIPLLYTAQAHGGANNVRHPTRSEIFVEGFMALAHGADGVVYYKYGTYVSSGLVDDQYRHDYEPYASKWQAVHDVFDQLDVMGDTLLLLTRRASYCAKDGGFLSPVTSDHNDF